MAQRKYHGMQVDPSQRTKAAEQTHAALLVLVDDLDLTDPVQGTPQDVQGWEGIDLDPEWNAAMYGA